MPLGRPLRRFSAGSGYLTDVRPAYDLPWGWVSGSCPISVFTKSAEV
jgi:hypothetical protein